LSLVPPAGRAQVAALLTVTALTGCSSSNTAPSGGATEDRLGVPVRLASCDDWRRSSYRVRVATIDDLESFAGGPSGSPAGHGTTLPDDEAYKYVDGHCRPRFARRVKLYKLYTRAAAFQSFRR
jgi:hypothetical protein